VRKRDHKVKITAGKQFRLAVLEPLLFSHHPAFGAVAIATGIIGRLPVVAGVTLVHMASHDSRATVFNVEHHLALFKRRAVFPSIVFAIEAKNVSDFPLRPFLRNGFGSVTGAFEHL
jgi:hypothetical protein